MAALRGVKPRRLGESFTYADAGFTPMSNSSIGLAASNPEGRFYGFVADEATRQNGEECAARNGVANVVFLTGSVAQISARLDAGSALPPHSIICAATKARRRCRRASARLCSIWLPKRLNPGG